MIRKNILCLGLLIITILLIISCKKNTEDQTISIGVVLPLTGIASIHGNNEREGINLAIKEINENGGINGRQVNVIYEDDQSEPTKTVTAIQKLIDVDNTKIIIGATWDILANAVIPVIDKRKVVLLSPSALPDTTTASSPYFFSVHSPVAINEKVIEKYIKDNDIKTVGILVVNNPWGVAHLNTFKKAVEATNISLLKEIKLQNFDNNDLSAELTLLKDLNLDAIFITINFNDAALFVRKRVELDLKSKILAHDNIASAIRNGRVTAENADGITLFSFNEPSEEFAERFYKEYNKKPAIYHDTSYDAVYAIKSAIEKYGYDSTDNIVKGLHEIKFSGASGEVYFGDNNYPSNKQPFLQIIKDGEFSKI